VAKTGAHYRFDRLVKYASQNSDQCYWVTPLRPDVTWFDQKFLIETSWSQGKRFSYFLYFLSFVLSFFRILKLRGKIKNIVVFGEHTLIFALACKLITGAKLSAGVRSN